MIFVGNVYVTSPQTAPASAPAPRAVRDVRLDFFRGVAMFIILFAHTPGNWVTLWIPARWGFSDATEMFVFCSGMASAIAFGATFDRAGILLGSARVVFRIWQVYWAHIGTFFATAALMVYFTDLDITGRNYWGNLNMWMLFVESDLWDNPNILLSVMTLQWVPNLFDILPMYMVILAMMPVVMMLGRVHFGLVVAASLVTWIFAQRALSDAYGLPYFNFTAEPWVGDDNWQRRWFLNPFGWQLAFFTGFAFMRGWLPKPPVTWWLVAICAVIVVANIPLSSIGVRVFDLDFARDWRQDNAAWFSKTDFGLLRFVQFLALAYLGWVIAGDKGNRIRAGTSRLGRVWAPVLAAILKVGQQSLAVFVVSILVGRSLGFVFDIVGRSYWTMTWVNALGIAVLIATAYGAAWMKQQPWRTARPHAAA